MQIRGQKVYILVYCPWFVLSMDVTGKRHLPFRRNHLTGSWAVLGCVLGAFWCHTSQTQHSKAFVVDSPWFLGSRTMIGPSSQTRD